MSAGLIGNVATIANFSAAIRRLPRVVGQKVATAAAPELTLVAQGTFNAQEDAYGGSWVPGAQGQRVTLRKGGGIFRGVHYVATGTRLRVKISVPYARYQLGKRPIFPRQSEGLPGDYVRALERATAETCRRELGQ